MRLLGVLVVSLVTIASPSFAQIASATVNTAKQMQLGATLLF
jgi:hypothetical protein